MSVPFESGIGFINYGRQTAKGTIATAATTTVGYNRLKHVGGGFKPAKTLGSEEYTDGNRFGNPSVFVNTAGGEVGSVEFQVQPENLGLFYAQILASDTVTGASDPYTHTITSGANNGLYGTWWQKAGSTVGPEREVYYDSKIGNFKHVTPRERNVSHVELSILALIAGEVYGTDPAKTEDTSDPYLMTETTGSMTFDGTVFTDVTESMVEIDEPHDIVWGDAVLPGQLIPKKGDIKRSFGTVMTDDALGKYRKAIYGTATPANGTKPVATVLGASVQQVFTRSATRTATILTPNVQIDPSTFPAVSPQPDGGKMDISFGGICRKSGANPQITVTVLSGDATTYA